MYLKTNIPVVLVLVLYCFNSFQAEAQSASCRDLRDENNELACDTKAYRAWLSAGKKLSNLGDICFDDLVELPKKCDMKEEFETNLALSEQHMNQPLLKYLKEYLNGPLIELYLEEHPDEPKLHLGNKAGGNCCQSIEDSPMIDTTNNLIKLRVGPYLESVGSNTTDPYEAEFQKLNDAVYLMMTDFVFRPCGRYLHIQDDLFLGQLKGSVQKFMNNNWDFLDKQSEEFRAAVFRYQYCSNSDLVTRTFDDNYDFWYQDDFYDPEEEGDSDSDDESQTPVGTVADKKKHWF